MTVAGKFNAEFDCLAETERYIGGRFHVPADRTGNGDRLTQVCPG